VGRRGHIEVRFQAVGEGTSVEAGFRDGIQVPREEDRGSPALEVLVDLKCQNIKSYS
jgi:hypothetical protein